MLDGIGNWFREKIPGAGLLDGDALSDVLGEILAARLAPVVGELIAAIRKQLLDALTPAPPITYAAELRAAGLNISDDLAAQLWGATFRAICADRRPKLDILQGGAS